MSEPTVRVCLIALLFSKENAQGYVYCIYIYENIYIFMYIFGNDENRVIDNHPPPPLPLPIPDGSPELTLCYKAINPYFLILSGV